MLRALIGTRPLAALLAAWAGALALILGTAAVSNAQHGAKAVTCTNNSSGASWQINIDYDHSTVDTIPASISDAEISWHTADGQNFRLDRKSGDLTVILASSTGGAFLYDRCKLAD
ncbi:MAG TPA: hypothetical protein VE396_09635 [Xanthobacteraceae bacterium]|jgi:hypothetical protein|nr:hypothetical protein [Xanthobacteraceae bacterium]